MGAYLSSLRQRRAPQEDKGELAVSTSVFKPLRSGGRNNKQDNGIKSERSHSNSNLVGALSTSRFLGDHFFFEKLTKANLIAASQAFMILRAKPGSRIIRRGEESDGVYIVVSGQVEISIVGNSGKQYVLRKMGTQEVFGEAGFIHNVSRTMDVDAVDKVVLLKLTRRMYEKHKDAPWMSRFRKWLQNAARTVVASGLAQIDFLSGLSPDKLEIIADLFRCQVVSKGTVLCRQGEPGNSFFVLSKGELVVTLKENEDDLDVELTRLKSGASFGEISLLDESPRTATVTALRESTLFILGRAAFKQFLQLAPSIHKELETSISERSAVALVSKKIPFVKSLAPNKLHLLATVCTIQRYKPNQVIIKEGTYTNKNKRFRIVSHGELDVFVGKKKVRTMRPGDYFGELSLFSNQPYTATVKVSSSTPVACLELTKADFEALFLQEPAVLAEIEMKILGKETELSHVLQHPLGQELFLQHCEKEFSKENVAFWCMVDELERLGRHRLRTSVVQAMGLGVTKVVEKKLEILRRKVMEIYNRFLVEDAPELVNLDAKTFREARLAVKQEKFTYHIFEKPKEEIYKLMERDNFARFKKSASFDELMRKVGAYEKRDHRKLSSVKRDMGDLTKGVLATNVAMAGARVRSMQNPGNTKSRKLAESDDKGDAHRTKSEVEPIQVDVSVLAGEVES